MLLSKAVFLWPGLSDGRRIYLSRFPTLIGAVAVPAAPGGTPKQFLHSSFPWYADCVTEWRCPVFITLNFFNTPTIHYESLIVTARPVRSQFSLKPASAPDKGAW
jgi:hypothetical protein